MSQVKEDNNAALITGASSGIGAAYARELLRRGRTELILTARRRERLERLREELLAHGARSVHVLPCDLAQVSAREELLEQVSAVGVQVDLLINNAGFGSLGRFSEAEIARELEMIEVNVRAPLHLCRYFGAKMAEAGEGLIINVCSTTAFQPMPYMATYGATKSFLLRFSMALGEELKDSGVHVVAHCPGPTESEFHLAVGLDKKLDALPPMSADRVVREALDGASRGRNLVIPGFGNRFLSLGPRLLSEKLSARIVERILRPYLLRKAQPEA